jgi:hypothetical protein
MCTKFVTTITGPNGLSIPDAFRYATPYDQDSNVLISWLLQTQFSHMTVFRGIVIMCHLQACSSVPTLDIKSFVGFRAIENSLVSMVSIQYGAGGKKLVHSEHLLCSSRLALRRNPMLE